jgi:hypothetical protein
MLDRSTRTLILLICLLANRDLLHAQAESDAHGFDHHHKHNELAVGTGIVRFPNESSWGYGVHLHGILGITEWMGAGAGYEVILGEYTHHALTGLVHFHPFHPLDINVGPGLVFPDDENPAYRFKLHAELAAVFELGEHFHLGPSLDVGLGSNDPHISLGIHVGWVID